MVVGFDFGGLGVVDRSCGSSLGNHAGILEFAELVVTQATEAAKHLLRSRPIAGPSCAPRRAFS